MKHVAGDRVGPYTIIAKLGEGGMGEVFRAHDSTLGRDVALKVLPEQFAGDRDRLARLEREARIMAALNHANIAAIHGLEESASGPALVLELIEGPTLADRLARGPLPIDEALGVGRQIAGAIEAAHEQGVVHRDLKPANIKIRPDGTVKVLDFGIAKILDVADQSSSDGQVTVSATSRGVLIGTTSYMSPEQARGAPATRQSDVWAFGAILFEMLTGKRTFTGTTTSDVLAAILRGTPDWSALPRNTPPALLSLLRRCLEREPRARLHDIGDARLEIEEAERAMHASTIDVRSAARSSRRVAVAVTIVGIAALAATAYLYLPRHEAIRQEIHLQMPPPSGMRFVSVPAISPDGRQIVFGAAPESGGPARLWLRPLSATAATELQGTSGASFPFWSADGRFIGFFAAEKLKRVAIAGGNPITICDALVGRGGLWLDDDTIVFAPTNFSPMARVNAAGGTPVPLTSLAADETGHRFPQRLPGRQLLYYSVNRAPEKSGVRLITMDEPLREIAFVRSMGAAEYVNGFLVFNGQPEPDSTYPLLAQRMSLPQGLLTGEPIEIGRARVSETLGRSVMATAANGVIATLGRAEGIGQFTWMSRDGRILETVGESAIQLGVELSPDRQQVATHRSREMWTMDLVRPVPTRLLRGNYRHPVWSPDGTGLLLLSQVRGIGTFDLVTANVATGDVTTMHQRSTLVKPVAWLRDGRLAWIEMPSSIMTMRPDEKPSAFLRDRNQTFEARVSPDGRWISYATDRSGRFEIEVQSFPEPGPRYPVSTGGGGYPRWRADGRELYFMSADKMLMATTFATGTPPKIGTPQPLFEVNLIAHPDRANFAAYEYDVSANGSRFLINRMVSPAETNLAVIVDWNPRR